MPPSARAEVAHLDAASLEELQARYPAEWQAVGEALVSAAAAGRPEALEAFVRGAREAAAPWRSRLQRSHGHPEVLASALPRLAAARMATLAMERTLLSAATGQAGGTVRLGRWSGTLIQALLFGRGLERRPVPLRAFRLVWPLVTQRRLLMPLVQPRGIYCFYSRELVRALAALLAGRPAVEIAAGDGTLSRFLRASGADVSASDDQSWRHAVSYPADVERLDAAEALARHRPRAVLCSFPPPGNGFERRVFTTPSVELYVVVTTRHRFAAGDWQAYQAQRAFDWGPDEGLSRLVLPPELDPAVLVFRRKA
ncbi:MAG: SAM-dependent methyltransferase [Anaeromyxobacter sp.]|nr:SAM-dependent methyltransferase [Anaeromyxobacter sp.]MBL0274638.1 SAM-dependent methyltransferase [Anaeromyxobacter sp.]